VHIRPPAPPHRPMPNRLNLLRAQRWIIRKVSVPRDRQTTAASFSLSTATAILRAQGFVSAYVTSGIRRCFAAAVATLALALQYRKNFLIEGRSRTS